MNQRMLILERLKNYSKLDGDAYRPKVNALEIDINNSLKHEFAKFLCVWLIRKGVEADNLPKIIKNHFFTKMDSLGIKGDISRYMTRFKHKWEVPEVVTEARFKDGKRRGDIFILDTGEIVEIETNHKIKKKGAITIYI